MTCSIFIIIIWLRVTMAEGHSLFQCSGVCLLFSDVCFFPPACQWYAFIAGLSGLLSINTLTAISVDRFFVITRPLQMMHAASTKRSLQHIAFVWIYALAWTTAPWYGWGRYIPEGFGISCTWDYLTRTPNNISFNSCFVIFQFVIPISTIIMCYSGMVMAVAKNRKQMSGMSNENSAQQKQEIKIAKVVAVNVFMFILSWLPYTTVAMLGISGHDQYVTPYTTEMPVMLAKASGAWNPIIYALSHPRYREALFKSSLPFKYFMKRDGLTKSESYSNVTRGSEISASVVDRSTRGETPTKHAAVAAVSASTQPEKGKTPPMMMESKTSEQPEVAGHDNESFTTHVWHSSEKIQKHSPKIMLYINIYYTYCLTTNN